MADLEILETLTIAPGDRLVVVLPERTTADQAELCQAVLHEKGWENDVLIIIGAEQLAVLKEAG